MSDFPLHQRTIDRFVKKALQEDIGPGDVTVNLLPSLECKKVEGVITAEEEGILAGVPFARRCFEFIAPGSEIIEIKNDGSCIKNGDEILRVKAAATHVLAAERTALNFLMRLSGIATATRKLVDAAKGRVTILDTRKTTPGFRIPEKYAVKIGGGRNHRMGLFDGILIKDNHKAALGGIKEVLRELKKQASHTFRVEIEISSPEELKEALEEGGFHAVLLDNMTPQEVKECLQLLEPDITVEVSGNIRTDNIGEYCIPGVHFISSGAITHSAPSLHFSMDIAACD